jgi:hypothetical protein
MKLVVIYESHCLPLNWRHAKKMQNYFEQQGAVDCLELFEILEAELSSFNKKNKAHGSDLCLPKGNHDVCQLESSPEHCSRE